MFFSMVWWFTAVVALAVFFVVYVSSAIEEKTYAPPIMGPYVLVLLVVGAVLALTWWLRSTGQTGLATIITSAVAIPLALYGLFLLVSVFSGVSWN